MSTVVKVIELIGESEESWEKAAENALKKADETLRNIVGLDVDHFTAKVEGGKIVGYRANVKIAFEYEG
ncbi:MAG: dodecin family protein [Promethearchaeia archaeon]